jgi:hypothetical protein
MAQPAENPSAPRPVDGLEDFPEIRPAAPEAPVRTPTRRVERPPAESSRRTRVQIRHVGVWSVFKFSVLFYFCLMLVAYFALLIIFLVMRASGAMDPIEKFLGEIFNDTATGTKTPPPLKIDGQLVFTWLFLAGCVGTVVWSAVNVFVALIYNLISDVVGGIEVTLTGRRPS